MLIFWKNTDKILEEEKALRQVVTDQNLAKLIVSE